MIYMDNAATTAVRKEVAEAMLPYLLGDYGNPSGVYRLSEKAKNVVEESRGIIADIINADRNEIFFTSGGTEGDNWAVKAESLKRKQGHIIVSSIEHHAVTESALWLKNYGIDVTFASVDEQGIIKLEQLEKMIRNDTFLISVMLANNEIGTIQPIENVCEIAHGYGAKVHSDAVAAFGHIDVDVKKLGVDFLNVSGHKICGPKGVGFLYVRAESQNSSCMEADRRTDLGQALKM
ncbi:MAG: cysteine desulfurase family protein [Lachnospira eligens]